MKAVILAIHTEPETAGTLRRVVTGLGHMCFEAGSDGNPDGGMPSGQPDVVIIDLSGNLSDQGQAVAAIRSRYEDCQIVLLADGPAMPGIMAKHRAEISEYIAKPIDEIVLEITLNRVLEKHRSDIRIRQLEHALENCPESKDNDLLETERFIVVKQLVDKMSYFIAEIAKDVEDGVKYFNSTPYFVAIHNCDLKIVANDVGYQKYFGKCEGGNSWDVYYGKTNDPDECPVSRTIQTGMVQRIPAVVRYKSGEKAPVIVHTAPIYDNNGRMALVLEVMAGSREIKRLRKELRTTQQKYQNLFDEVPDYIAVLDRKFRVTAVNRRFKEEFGDQTGARFFDIFNSFSGGDCPLRKTLEEGEPQHLETELITREGKRFATILSTAPVNAVGGRIFQIIVIFKDVTELRRLEDNLSTLGLMFSVISHNIKNVLTGLDAGLYHIDQGFYKNIPGRIEEGLEVANLMVYRIRKMILDVLYYAKPRELELKGVKVNDLVNDVARQVQPKMGARNIEFCWHGVAESTEIQVDKEIFRSILSNLLENAMEACMDQKLDKHYQIHFTADSNEQYVRFDVRDNGAGIEEDKKDKIFSKFFSTKGHKGTGLGLFIAKQVIDQHGGEIRVETAPGKGSHFTVLMPRRSFENLKLPDDCHENISSVDGLK